MRQICCCCEFQVWYPERYTHRNDSIDGFIYSRVLSPRVQLNVHVAQTSMWFVGVRSARSGRMLRWSATGLFRSNAAQLYECAFALGRHGFHTAVGALVLICFVAPCRYHLLVRALWWIPQSTLLTLMY